MDKFDPLKTVPGELTAPPPAKDPVKHAHDAMRLAFVIASVAMAAVNLEAFLVIGDWPPALLKTVALVSAHPVFLTWAFGACFAAAVPFIVIQIALPMCRWRAGCTRWSSVGHFVAGALWAGMAIVSAGLDYSNFGVGLWIKAVANLAFGFALGMANNHELLRAMAERE